MSAKCLDCGEQLTEEMTKCPKCGSGNRSIAIPDKCHGDDSLFKLKKKSAEKDGRGKPIIEEEIKVEVRERKIENIITRDRSKRLNGKKETDVYHEVKVNGETTHPRHLEPKGKRNRKLREGN